MGFVCNRVWHGSKQVIVCYKTVKLHHCFPDTFFREAKSRESTQGVLEFQTGTPSIPAELNNPRSILSPKSVHSEVLVCMDYCIE